MASRSSYGDEQPESLSPALSTDERYRALRNAADDYTETVQALIGFAAFVCHDGRARRSNSQYGFGRRMTTSAANRVSPTTTVTPDIVVQKTGSFGIAGEVKKSMSRSQEQWEAHRRQLRKYDDNLTGWWTADETIVHSEAILLIHQSRGRAFGRYLDAERVRDPDSVGDHSAVVEFNRADEGQSYIFFRREWGTVCDAELAARLDDGVQVPMDRVLRSFPSVRFYDAMPPVESLLAMLWGDSFMSRFDPSRADPATGLLMIPVTVGELTSELQQAYGSGALHSDTRGVEFPKATWIRVALDKLVAFDLARGTEDRDSFIIKYKPLTGDLLERFSRLNAPKPGKDDQQLDLLSNA